MTIETHNLFRPNGEQKPCVQCSGFGEMMPSGVAWCAKFRYMRAQPENGCAFFLREGVAFDNQHDMPDPSKPAGAPGRTR